MKVLFKPLTALAASLLVALCLAATDPISISVDGELLQPDKHAYLSEEGVVMVPMRDVFDAAGADIRYDPDTQLTVAVTPYATLVLRANSLNARLRDEPYILNHPAVVRDGTMFVPLHVVDEGLPCEASWNEATNQVTVTTGVDAVLPPDIRR